MPSVPLQLDLFADHVALLNRGKGALAEFDLDTALESFAAVLATVPSHADASAACERTRSMRALLDERVGGDAMDWVPAVGVVFGVLRADRCAVVCA